MTDFSNDLFHFTGDRDGFTTEDAVHFVAVWMTIPGMNQLPSPVKCTSLNLEGLVDLGIKDIV